VQLASTRACLFCLPGIPVPPLQCSACPRMGYVKMRFYEEKPEQEKFSDPYYLQLLELALADENASYSFGMDRIYRKIGEYYEANDQPNKTIEIWDRAIAINGKVGIARRLELLKKKMSQ